MNPVLLFLIDDGHSDARRIRCAAAAGLERGDIIRVPAVSPTTPDSDDVFYEVAELISSTDDAEQFIWIVASRVGSMEDVIARHGAKTIEDGPREAQKGKPASK